MDYRSAVDLWSAQRADRQALVTSSQLRLTAPRVNLPPLMAQMLSTTSDFFPMFDVPFRYGHAWTAQDDAARARVAVISSDLNDKLFNGADSVGRTLRLKDSDVRIIGVLAPWRPSPQFYDVAGGRFSNGKTAGFYARPEDVFMPFESSLEINAGGFNVFTCWRMPDNPQDLQHSPCVWVALWVQLGDAAKVRDYTRFVADYAAQQKALGRFVHADNTRLPSLINGWTSTRWCPVTCACKPGWPLPSWRSACSTRLGCCWPNSCAGPARSACVARSAPVAQRCSRSAWSRPG